MTSAQELVKKHCAPCEGDVTALTADQIHHMKPSVPAWKLADDGKRIRREWRVRDFLAAIEFFQQIAQIAELENHHPDLHLEGYRNVAIELSTHAVGALTENDFILAAKIDQLTVPLKK